MIKTSVCFLFIIHLCIALFYSEIISTETLILLLYLSNVLLATITISWKCYSLAFRRDEDICSMTRSHTSTSCTSIIETSKTLSRPNLYILRWQKKFLNQSQQFPLDRLAYLSAKHYKCSHKTKFSFKDSDMKAMVRKPENALRDQYENEPHPSELVKEASGTYIHMRAAMYRNRKTTIADRKQTTLHKKKVYSVSRLFHRLSKMTPPSSESFSTSVLSDECSGSVGNRSESEEEEEEDDDSIGDDDDDRNARRPSVWKRISGALKRSRKKEDSEEFS